MDHLDNPSKGDRREADTPTASSRPPSGPRIDNLPDVNAIDEERLQKIARLKQAVADGTYRVSAEEVARKLFEHMLEPKD